VLRTDTIGIRYYPHTCSTWRPAAAVQLQASSRTGSPLSSVRLSDVPSSGANEHEAHHHHYEDESTGLPVKNSSEVSTAQQNTLLVLASTSTSTSTPSSIKRRSADRWAHKLSHRLPVDCHLALSLICWPPKPLFNPLDNITDNSLSS
jgi:hypothetical protein